MKRRLFLKLFGGVAAAPAVMPKAAVASSVSAFPMTAAMSAVELLPDTDEGPPGFGRKFDKFKRLAKLRRLITGKDKEKESSWSVTRRLTHFEESRLNGLRSISDSAKLRMLHKQLAERAEIDSRRTWIEEFARLREGE